MSRVVDALSVHGAGKGGVPLNSPVPATQYSALKSWTRHKICDKVCAVFMTLGISALHEQLQKQNETFRALDRARKAWDGLLPPKISPNSLISTQRMLEYEGVHHKLQEVISKHPFVHKMDEGILEYHRMIQQTEGILKFFGEKNTVAANVP